MNKISFLIASRHKGQRSSPACLNFKFEFFWLFFKKEASTTSDCASFIVYNFWMYELYSSKFAMYFGLRRSPILIKDI